MRLDKYPYHPGHCTEALVQRKPLWASLPPSSNSELSSHPCFYKSRNKYCSLVHPLSKGTDYPRKGSVTHRNQYRWGFEKVGWLHRIRYWSCLFSQLLLCSPPVEAISNLPLIPKQDKELSPEQAQCVTILGHGGIPSSYDQNTMNKVVGDPPNTAWQLRLGGGFKKSWTHRLKLVWSPKCTPAPQNSEESRNSQGEGRKHYINVWRSMNGNLGHKNKVQDFKIPIWV